MSDSTQFSLPVEQKVFVPVSTTFQGLWGVFADSLPDAWGRLLVDRMLREKGISADWVSPLERLAIVGTSGMGALTYRPAWDVQHDPVLSDLDELSARCSAILNHEDVSDLDELFRLGGSSGGARPKVMTDEWIIKFPASGDMHNVGVMEKEYMDTAAACGILVPETKLMPSQRCDGYFAIRRFDRDNGLRRHTLSAAAILEADWRSASLDYNTIMKLTGILSRSNEDDLVQMYRRMCFNVFAHNRDDHAKNFSWIYDAKYDCWHPSPAFDETAEVPQFKECAKHPHIDEMGYVLYYTNQCPFNGKYVPILEKTASDHGIPFRAIKIENKEQAQATPSPCTTYALFKDGIFLTNEQQNDKKFLKLVQG